MVKKVILWLHYLVRKCSIWGPIEFWYNYELKIFWMEVLRSIFEVILRQKQIIVVTVKTYETTEHILLYNSSKKTPRNFVLTNEYLFQLLNSIVWAWKKKRFKIYRLEELQRNINEGSEPVAKVVLKKDFSTKVEERTNHDKKLQIKEVKVTKKINYQSGGGNGWAHPRIFLSTCQAIMLLYMSKWPFIWPYSNKELCLQLAYEWRFL